MFSNRFLQVSAAVLFFVCAANGQDDWSKLNTSLEIGWNVSHAFDVGTTVIGLRSGLRETNPFAPNEHSVLVAGFVIAGLHGIGSRILDEPFRTIYQIVTIALKLYAVSNNLYLINRRSP